MFVSKKLGRVLAAVCAVILSAGSLWAQSISVTGKVVDVNNEPIIGAYVVVAGTTVGTSTDANGAYRINAPANGTLQFTCIGYKTQEVQIAGRTLIEVILSDDTEMLQETVVTALGIKKERKALGYSVTEVKSEELLRNKQTNVINSLAGKVPGVNVTQSSGAAGSGASIIIRGGNSASEGRDNQPLFVVDGVIYDNSTSVLGSSGADGMTRSNTTWSNRVMDINPEDIESMSVLKGAAAAALYGSRAADGAIIITTKKGAEGTVKVDVSSKTSLSWANKVPQAQNIFGYGSYSNNGVLTDLTYSSWGEKISGRSYDNIGNFFQNGLVLDNNVSISGGSKSNTFYLSASNFDQKGIVPNTGYDKTTVRFNGEQKAGRLTVAANVTYSIARTDKTLTSGGLYDSGGIGSMSGLYMWPANMDMAHYQNEDGTKYRVFEDRLTLADDIDNPYWIINKNQLYDNTNRFTGALTASFNIAPWWDVTARVGYDNYTTDAYTYIAPGASMREMYQNGRLNRSDYNYRYLSTNVMSNMHKTFGAFDLNILLGATTEDTKRHNQILWGYDFITAGTISFGNIETGHKFFRDVNSLKRLVGVYGEFRAAYKNIAYLTVTGRNDWSSTLPVENRSYFYPSVSGSFVFTELLPKNNFLTFGKIRASWAEVGKDANPYATNTYLVSPYTYGSFTLVGNNYVVGNPYLVPEIQRAWELGAELKFFNGLLGIDWTYYHSQTFNQIASPRLSNANGSIMTSINSGSVINKGMEIAITATPVNTRDFTWDLTLNGSYNRGILGDFLEGVGMFYPTDAQFGGVKAAAIPGGGDFLGIVGTRFQRESTATGVDENGKTIYTEMDEGAGRYVIDPTTGLYKVSSDTYSYLGNREPRFIGGLNNILRYKNLTFAFLLDFRIGGDVYDGTTYYMVSHGTSPLTTLNDRQSVTFTGVTGSDGNWTEETITYKADENYTISGTTYSGRAMIQKYWSNYLSNSYNFITSVNWLKLRSVSLTYDFSNLLRKQSVVKRLTASVIGTNLLTWTNYTGMDPEVSTAGGTGGSGSTGIDYCSVPAVSSVSFGLNLTF